MANKKNYSNSMNIQARKHSEESPENESRESPEYQRMSKR